jgi:SAM-dependent methyltransferase
VCECAYCTFPNKHAAASEIARVLRPGGQFGLGDLTRSGALPPELDGLFAWVACIADALPIEAYADNFEAVGLRTDRIETHDEALTELIRQIRGRLVGAELLTKLDRHNQVGMTFDVEHAKALARRAAEAAAAGTLGYALMIARKS